MRVRAADPDAVRLDDVMDLFYTDALGAGRRGRRGMTPGRILPVEGLFDVPDEAELASDEIHDPDNWVRCRACGLDCPADSESC